MKNASTARFQKLVWDYYHQHGRDLPWRQTSDPYKILVSEIMLQQTQVSRVMSKYVEFTTTFPTIKALANATPEQVLRVWQGMGYNRRAIHLHRIAHAVMNQYDGAVPKDIEALDTLPGIGPATARSIFVFSWNEPESFIETNIRRVFIHHFFTNKLEVDDKVILPLVRETLDSKRPRDWYYALMDYGSYLATQMVNPNRRSKHYLKQSKFEGSDRQIRGKILKLLLAGESLSNLTIEKNRLDNVIQSLLKDGLVKKRNKRYVV